MNLLIALMVINGIHFAYSDGFYPGDFFIKGPTSKATIYGVDGSEIQSVADAGSISTQGIQGATSSTYAIKSGESDASPSLSKDCDSDCAYKSGGSGVVIKGPTTSAVIKGPSNGASGTNYNQPSSYQSHQSQLIYGKSNQITTVPCDSTTKDCGTTQIPSHLRTNSSDAISELTVQSPSATQEHYKSVQFEQDVTRPCAGQDCATTQESYGLHSSQKSPNVVIQGPSTSAFIKGPRSNGVALGKYDVADKDNTNSNLGGWDKPFSFPQTNSGGSYVIQGPSASTLIKTFHGNSVLGADRSGSETNQNSHSGLNKYSNIRSSTVDIQGPSASAFIKGLGNGKYSQSSNLFASTSSLIKDNPALESHIEKYAIPAKLVFSGSSGTYKERVQPCDPSSHRCDDRAGITGGNKAFGSQSLGIGTQSGSGQNDDQKIGIQVIYGSPAQTGKSSFGGGPFKNYDAPVDKGYFESSSFPPATYSKPDSSREDSGIYQSSLPSSGQINGITWESGLKQNKNLGYNCYVIKFSVPGNVAPSEYSPLLDKISRSVAKDFERHSQYHQHHYNL